MMIPNPQDSSYFNSAVQSLNGRVQDDEYKKRALLFGSALISSLLSQFAVACVVTQRILGIGRPTPLKRKQMGSPSHGSELPLKRFCQENQNEVLPAPVRVIRRNKRIEPSTNNQMPVLHPSDQQLAVSTVENQVAAAPSRKRKDVAPDKHTRYLEAALKRLHVAPDENPTVPVAPATKRKEAPAKRDTKKEEFALKQQRTIEPFAPVSDSSSTEDHEYKEFHC